MSFAQTRIEALADLAQETEDLTLPAGQILWRAGDVADHALMPISGIIACETDDGRQKFKFDPGSTVGGIDALANMPRWYQAQAETPVRTLRVEGQRLLDVIEDNIELGMDMLRVFGLGLRQLQVDRVRKQARRSRGFRRRVTGSTVAESERLDPVGAWPFALRERRFGA